MMMETRGTREGRFDWPLVIAVYGLSIFGLLCIAMARYVPSQSEGLPLLNKILNNRSSMWQSIFILVSPIIVGVIVAIPTEFIKARVRLVYYGVLALLLVTLVLGQVSNGLRGWLRSDILGRSIQVSEFSKLSILLMLARQLARSEKPMSKFKDFMSIMIIVGLPSLTVLAQGETGTVIVIAFMFMIMIYFAGVDLRIIIAFALLAVIGVGALVAYGMLSETTDYRILRLLAFLDPQKYEQSGGYQILMSQKAIGAGQLTGQGTFLPGSWTTLGYVPESSTDAIFTVVGESFGFVGWDRPVHAGQVLPAGHYRRGVNAFVPRVPEHRHVHGHHAHYRYSFAVPELRRLQLYFQHRLGRARAQYRPRRQYRCCQHHPRRQAEFLILSCFFEPPDSEKTIVHPLRVSCKDRFLLDSCRDFFFRPVNRWERETHSQG